MSGNKKANDYHREAAQHLRDTADAFVFDPKSGTYQPKPKEVQKPVNVQIYQAPSEQRPKANRAEIAGVVVSISSCLISIFTLMGLVGTAIVTVRQWKEARRTAEASIAQAQVAQDALAETKKSNSGNSRDNIRAYNLSKESLEDVQRAFIGYVPVQVDLGLGKLFAGVEGSWNNSGNTPALDIWSKFHFEKSRGAVPDPGFPFDNADHVEKFVLAAHGTTFFSSPPIEQTDIRMAGPFGYFYGWAIYRDVFAHTPIHLTEFCVQIYVVADLRINSPTSMVGRQASCATHNCFDQECQDYNDRKREVTLLEADPKRRSP